MLVSGTVVFTTNQANAAAGNACGAGGTSESDAYLNFLDYKTGGAVSTANTVAGRSLGKGFATRPVPFMTPDGGIKVIVRISGPEGGGTGVFDVPIGSVAKYTRRVSWKELVND